MRSNYMRVWSRRQCARRSAPRIGHVPRTVTLEYSSAGGISVGGGIKNSIRAPISAFGGVGVSERRDGGNLCGARVRDDLRPMSD